MKIVCQLFATAIAFLCFSGPSARATHIADVQFDSDGISFNVFWGEDGFGNSIVNDVIPGASPTWIVNFLARDDGGYSLDLQIFHMSSLPDTAYFEKTLGGTYQLSDLTKFISPAITVTPLGSTPYGAFLSIGNPPSVPDAGSTLGLLTLGGLALRVLRRRWQ